MLIVDELGSHRNVRRTPDGEGWIVPATLTRTGIFTYVEQGKVLRVLRAPEDVFADESVASLAYLPVTVYHPKERLVRADNYREVNVGTVAPATKLKDRYLASDLIIRDGATGADLDAGKLSDISMGYRADYARTKDGEYESGTWNGQHYDRRQINIRYNHVSLGPKGWGRAGTDVGVQLDHVDDYLSGMDNVFADQVINDEADAKPAPPVVTPVNDQAAVIAELRASNDKLAAQLAVLTAIVAKPAPAVPAATPAPDAAAVAARQALVADAKLLDPKLVCDGLTDDQVRAAALGAFDTSIKTDGQSVDYVRAGFDFAVANRRKVVASHAQVAGVVTAPAQTVTDSVAEAERAMQKSNASRYEEYNKIAASRDTNAGRHLAV